MEKEENCLRHPFSSLIIITDYRLVYAFYATQTSPATFDTLVRLGGTRLQYKQVMLPLYAVTRRVALLFPRPVDVNTRPTANSITYLS